jgi:hypothetical protein
MSTSQVLDRTFFLYRKNFVLFAGIAAITPLLTTVDSLAQLAVFGMPVSADQAARSAAGMQQFFGREAIGGFITLCAYLVGYTISAGATVHAVSMLHLGRATTIKESYQRVKPIFGRLLLLMIRIFLAAMWPIIVCYVVGVVSVLVLLMVVPGVAGGNAGGAIGIGLMLLLVFVGALAGVVWAAIVYCRYALAVPACTVEGLPIKYSLIRSKFLAKDNLGRVFVVYLLTTVIGVAVAGLLQAPLYMSAAFSFRTGLQLTPGWLAWTYASQFIGTMVAGPIAAIAMALVYYDQRVRKEAFDLQLMMDAMKPGEATQTASAHAAP